MTCYRQFLFFLLLFFPFTRSFSQQDPEIFQFANNRLLYNNAFAGLDNETVVNSLYNWSYPTHPTFQGPINPIYSNPTLLAFSAGTPIHFSRTPITNNPRGGMSIAVLHNTVGYIRQNTLRIGMNKSVSISRKTEMRLGVEWLRQNRKVFYSKLNPAHSDQSDANNGLNVGMVLANKEWNSFYTGVSISHVTQEKFRFSDSAYNIGTSPLIRHYYIVSGIEFHNIFGIDKFHFIPAFLLRFGERSLAMAGNYSTIQTTFSYDKKLELGAIISAFDYAHIQTGVVAAIYPLQFFKEHNNTLRLGYSLMPSYFNQLISGFSYHHEISISFIGPLK